MNFPTLDCQGNRLQRKTGGGGMFSYLLKGKSRHKIIRFIYLSTNLPKKAAAFTISKITTPTLNNNPF